MTEPSEEEIEERARQLSQTMPDEYPQGFARYVAEEQLREERKSNPCVEIGSLD